MADVRTTDIRTLVPDEYNRQEFNFPNTFAQDVKNAWELTWFGQTINELNDDDSYLNYPDDSELDVYSYLENTPYLQYQDHFKNMRNADHIQHVKNKIDRNNFLRQERDDAGILPDLIAQLGDPLTYVPIPFVKGLTMGSRFLKTGAASGLLVGSSEPLRQQLDPTATIAESSMYIGGAFILGGGLGAAFGRRLAPKTEIKPGQPEPQYFGPISEKTETEVVDDMMGAMWDMDHKIFKYDMYNPKSDVTYTPATETIAGRLGYKLDTAALNGYDEIGNPLFVKISAASDNRNKYINDTIRTDDAKIHKAWKDQSYNKNNKGIYPLPRFKSPDDLKKFLIEKEHIKYRGLKPKGDTVADIENKLNKEVLEKIELEETASRKLSARGKVSDKIGQVAAKLITDQDRLTNNTFKNKEFSNWIADTAEELSGDYSLTTIGNKEGRITPHSANTKSQLNTLRDTQTLKRVLDNNYTLLLANKAEGIKLLGNNYNLTKGGQQIGAFAEDKLNKLKRLVGSKTEETHKKITFQEYNERVGMAIRDPDYFAIQPDAIKKAANEMQQHTQDIGQRLVKENIMYSQQSISGKKTEWQTLLQQAKKDLANAKDPEVIKVINNQIKKAQDELAIYDDELDDLILDPDRAKDFLLENYFPREISRNKVIKDKAEYDKTFIAPEKGTYIEKKINKGMYPGMVVKFTEPKSTTKMYGNIAEINKNGSIVVEYPKGVSQEVTKITIPKNKIQLKSPMQFKQQLEYYSIPNEQSFRGKLFKSFVGKPKKFEFKDIDGNTQVVFESSDNFNVNIRVNNAIQSITRDAKIKDIENSIGYEKTDTGYLPYQSHFMRRKLPVEDKEIMEFLNHDANYMFRNYIETANKKIEISKKFGDPHMKLHIWKTRQQAYTKEYKTKNDAKKIEIAISQIEAQRDKMYGIYNSNDVDDFFKARVPVAMRNWASTTMMGVVTMTSQVDWARIPMVHGFTNFIKSLDGTANLFRKDYFDADKSNPVKQNKFVYEAGEIAMNNAAMSRILAQNEKVSDLDDFAGRFFFRPMEKIQAPFYHINGLSMHTNMVKDQAGIMSSHRFIEDALAVANGTADNFTKTRLNSYGISPADARGLAKLDFDRVSENGLILMDEKKWYKSLGKNADYLLDKMRVAVYADVQRTVITPSVADKPNMMYGVVPIRTENMTPLLLGMSPEFVNSNPGVKKAFEFFLGFEKTEFGAKLNNGWFAAPLQFFAWSFGANRKLMLAGLSDKEMNLAGGVIAMIGFAAIIDRQKNPQYYKHKTMEEKIYRAIEMSGVLGLPGDLNFIMETMTEGFGDEMYGIRKALGTPGRFGQPNEADALGEITGPSLGMPIDLFHAFNEDLPFDEKAQTIRRLIPFNNLILWRGIFRSLYDFGAETIK